MSKVFSWLIVEDSHNTNKFLKNFEWVDKFLEVAFKTVISK